MAEEWGNHLVLYLYDAGKSPIGMQYRNTSYAEGKFDTYWFEKNLQGDVVAVYNQARTKLISYTYDDYGNILTVSEGTTLKLSYTYDELNQLTRENNAYANKTYVYTYDKNGNILTKKTYAYTTGTLGSVQNTVNYTYGNSSWKDLLTNYNGTSISYDGIGNPTNWRGNLNTLTWTGRELTGITMPSSQTMSYKYNSDGIRTQKTFTDNAVKYYYKHDYIVDGSNIVAETITYFTYFGTSTTETLYYYYDESGAPNGIKYNGNVYYFQKNLQGDIIRILNSSGTIVATYTYDAWGNIIASTDTSGVSIGTKNPFRYRGYYYDTETGLYYLNSRYYDPQVGRFLNADGFVSTGQGLLGSNMFAYCLNNPVNMTDSFGDWPQQVKESVKWLTKNVAKPITDFAKAFLSNYDYTYSTGINFSGTPSIFIFNFQIGLSMDTKGNIAIQGSAAGGFTGGSPGASVSLYQSVTNAPNIYKLEGPGYQVGGSVGFPIPKTPIAAVVGGDFVMIPDEAHNALYHGMTSNVGLGTPGGEFHVEWGSTSTLPFLRFNVFEIAELLYNIIMEW